MRTRGEMGVNPQLGDTVQGKYLGHNGHNDRQEVIVQMKGQATILLLLALALVDLLLRVVVIPITFGFIGLLWLASRGRLKPARAILQRLGNW